MNNRTIREGEALHYALFDLRRFCRRWYHRSHGQPAYDQQGRLRDMPADEEIKAASSHRRVVIEFVDGQESSQ